MHDPKFLRWLVQRRHRRKLSKERDDKLRDVLLKRERANDKCRMARAFKKMKPRSPLLRLMKDRFRKIGRRIPFSIKMWAKDLMPAPRKVYCLYDDY